MKSRLDKEKYRYKVIYYINNDTLYEYREETKVEFKYDLLGTEIQKELFKTRLRQNAKRDYKVEIKVFDMYYLSKWGWL